MPNLVGIGLSQVPTNSMLGGMAYQDPEHASIKDLDLKNLSQINSEIADTASAIFVYDTRKDSDGGAWRKRTQDTSWYNETLGTVRRGTRREFPAVAVIVAENDGLTIYDGDDPDLPMWMKWTTTIMLRGNAARALAAKNGIIAITNAATYGGLVKIYFVSDTARSYRTLGSNNKSEGYWSGPGIASRDDYSSNNYSNASGGNVLPALVSETTKDVAMTVLPNAPIDSATGLPIPTIAVATIGGVSVIKDDGNVADTTSSNNGYTHVRSVEWASNGDLLFVMGDTNGYLDYLHTYDGFNSNDNVISIDTKNGSSKNARSSFRHASPGTTAYASHQYDGFTVRGSDGAPNYAQLHPVAKKDPFEYGVKSPQGLTHISENPDSKGSLVAHATTTYNTGWMHGDIKGAFLSDTDTTNLTGTELITNGTFDSNTNGWTSQNSATITHTTPSAASIHSPSTDGLTAPSSAGIIKMVSNGGGSGAYQSFTTVVGKTYTASFIAYQVNAGSNYVKIGTSIGGHQNYDFYDQWDQSVNNNWASGSATFTATATTTYITLWPSQVSGRVLYMDQISVRLADPDRSVNNKGLQVFGTVTKTPVATGADLVAYSGFSASNYLQQSANSDFAFGTGDFSVILWYKSASSGSVGNREVLAHTDTWLVIKEFTNYFKFGTLSATTVVSADNLYHVAVVRSSGNASIYVNGSLEASASDTTNITNSNRLMIGQDPSNAGWNVRGSMSLVRLSTSTPSAEQVKKMYEDEKCLFHENAKATLYGSSDAVTALAYDDTTNLLHVGTSAGRSEFQGLRRINNTTTAVTTAISASNGFVAEQ